MKLNWEIKFLFYSFWFVGLLLQAYFTEITADEAYYWMYSRELAWGYFDHPPVIALIIKWGYFFICQRIGSKVGSCNP